MAIVPMTGSTIADSMALHYADKLVSLVNQHAKTVSLLSKKEQVGGNSYNFVMPDAGITVSSFAETDTYSDAASTGYKTASVGWARRKATFALTDHALDVAQNGHPADIMPMAFNEMNRACSLLFGKATDGLNAQLFTTTNTAGSFVGLRAAIATGNTVYGVDQSSVTDFQGNIVSGGAAALTLAKLNNCFETTGKRAGSTPDLIVASYRDWEYLNTLISSKMTFPVNQAELRNGIVASGITGLSHRGATIIADKDCPDGYVFGLNTEHVYLAFLSPYVNEFNPQVRIVPAISAEGVQSMPLRLRTATTFAPNQSFAIETTCALVVEQPNSCFILNNFTAPA